MVIRTHDLIEVSSLSCLRSEEVPMWAAASLKQTPFVVGRRAEPLQDGSIPVGIRGTERNQRHAAFLAPQGIGRSITPYEITERRMWTALSAERQGLPVSKIMDRVAELMRDWQWGPTGSAGFEMVTGYPAMKETSDLDVVINTPVATDDKQAEILLCGLDKLGVRIDIQLEAPEGAYILRELVGRRADTVMLRTAQGPRLVRNPWR
ncbi:malonate decarboxylase holo-ACP synthase [Paenibacillus sp. FSL M7-0896]|uniref:malonate decarboxylase holo-ACP synthase n=1 Tax=Paenibacillus sp. FSL M7-0896 TaxID=2921610 RepID=UPI0030DB5470